MNRAILLCALALAVVSCGAALGAEKAEKSVAVGEYTISGPFSHGNLTVFLIHGQDKLKGKTFITLDEALKQKIAVVHETSNVSELSVENKSPTVHIYIQSGVIVKGGKQDRTLQHDMIVAPRSGKVPIKSFCVEASRWRRRGSEPASKFASAKSNLSSKQLKLAARARVSQGDVWKEVGKAQGKLSSNLGQSVKARASASSLQLTLENKKLKSETAKYSKTLGGITAGKKNVIGYAFAINGEINSADIYGSRQLFGKLWPSLLDASAVEAISELKKGKTFAAPKPDAVKALILDAQKGKKTEQNLSKTAKIIIKESEKSILFEAGYTDDGGMNINSAGPLRKQYIDK